VLDCLGVTKRGAEVEKIKKRSSKQSCTIYISTEQHMYQTFFTKECLPYTHPGFACELQYVEFLTAVFHPLSSNPEDVILRPVKIPSGCAMVLL